MGKSELTPRKIPTQSRSRATVAAILEAAARVFAERGFAAASTNRIAEMAGVSVGSLYEYFPNKESILVALAEERLQRMVDDILALLATRPSADESLEALLRRFVTAMLDVHERDPELHGWVFSESPHPAELHACVLRVEETLAHTVEDLLRERAELCLADPDTAAHLVVQTAEALTHRFVHHGIHDLSREAFVGEVVALLGGYLSGGGSVPA